MAGKVEPFFCLGRTPEETIDKVAVLMPDARAGVP